MLEPTPPNDPRPAPLDRRLYGWLAVAFCGVVVATRLWPGQVGHPLNLFEAYAAYALLPIWPALAYARWRKLRELTAACLLLALAHLGWTLEPVPRALAARRCGEHDVPLRLLTANLLAPAPSPAFAREILEAQADVIVASELSDGWSRLFGESGVYRAHPHVRAEVIPASESYFGIGVLSRHPITAHRIEHVEDIPMVRVDLDVGGAPLRVHAFHAHPPMGAPALALWQRQLGRIEELLAEDVRAGRAVVLAGDFNATTMTRGYRRLIELGLRSAHESAGRPFATTWPNGMRDFPPVRIDHVLSSGLGVGAVREGAGEGSDHRPIVTELCIPAATSR